MTWYTVSRQCSIDVAPPLTLRESASRYYDSAFVDPLVRITKMHVIQPRSVVAALSRGTF